MDKLEELKKKYEELGKEIERLEKCNKRWRAEKNEDYYYIDVDGKIETYFEAIEGEEDYCDFCYKTRNYFKTFAEADEYHEKINTYYDLMDLAEELNNGEEIDWVNENGGKYYLYYDPKDKYLGCGSTWSTERIGTIYCLNEDFLKIAKERIGEERLIKLFKE